MCVVLDGRVQETPDTCMLWIGGLYGSPMMGGTKPGNEWDWESLFLLLLLILSLLFLLLLLLLFQVLSHSLLFPDFQSDSLPTPHSLFCSLVTGDNLASSWAVIMSMGEDGYMKVVKTSHGGHKEVRMKESVNTVEVRQSRNMTMKAFKLWP